MLLSKIVEACTPWHVNKTYHLYDLTIREGAQLIAPEGKFLTLTVNGCGRDIRPGSYHGDVVVSVTEPYIMGPHGLMVINQVHTPLKQAAVIMDNKVVESQCVPAILQDAVVGDTETDGLYLASSEEDFNGIVIDGHSDYTTGWVWAPPLPPLATARWISTTASSISPASPAACSRWAAAPRSPSAIPGS